FVLVFLVQELISREFEGRYFLSSLSFPCTRAQFLVGRFFVVFFLVQGLLVAAALLLSGVVFLVLKLYGQTASVALGIPYWITILFLSLDILVLVALATLLAVTASTPSFVLVG